MSNEHLLITESYSKHDEVKIHEKGETMKIVA